MKTLIEQIAQDRNWTKWMARNASEDAGCISAAQEQRAHAVKQGCISIARGTCLPKAGCVS